MKIKLEFPGGTEISEAAAHAVTVSQMVGAEVRFEFNGVNVVADTSTPVESVVDQYHTKLYQREKKREQEREQDRPRPRAVLSRSDVRSPSARAIGQMIDALEGATPEQREQCMAAVQSYYSVETLEQKKARFPSLQEMHQRVNEGLCKT